MDNTPAAYAKEAVEWAKKEGILQGTETGDLMLQKSLTRQQFVVMLYRYHKSSKK